MQTLVAGLLHHMKEFARTFYKSKAWKDTRDYIIRRDGYLCADCMRAGKYTPAEEVHHIIELTPENITDERITLNPDNLISLCRECHRKRHGARDRRYKVDDMGRVATE